MKKEKTLYVAKMVVLITMFSMLSFVTLAQPFITTWKTDNPGVSATNQITIPTAGGGYNYTIYWEQVGNPAVNGTLNNQTSSATITFPSVGTYRVEISGSFPRIFFNNTGDRQKILTVTQWGNIAWTSMFTAFYGCTNLTIPATDSPNLSGVTNMAFMFDGATSFNQDINSWNVGSVISMAGMFYGATAFNQPIGNWDVGNVTTMYGMFWNASAFNQPIGNWNVSSVTDMHAMFAWAIAFDQDISNWDVGSVTDMNDMFYGEGAFNQPIGNWDVSNVTNMFSMFTEATTFNQPIGNWDVSSVTTMEGMFVGARAFNQPIGNWDVSSVTTMQGMFARASAFNQSIGSWNVGSVISMGGMFYGATTFDQPIGNWDVASVIDMSSMFFNASAFNQNIGSWDVSNVTNMTDMLNNSGLSTANYDATLIGWAAQPLQPNVALGAIGRTYCAATTAHAVLIGAPNNWTITGDAYSCPQAIVYVTVGSIGRPNGSTVAFSSTLVDSSTDLNFVISNTGSAPMDISGIAATGDFVVTALPPISIPAGSNTTFGVRFSPTIAGTRIGTFTINSNASVPVFTINLSGVGQAPVAAIEIKVGGSAKPSGSDIVFSTVGIGNDQIKQLDITNTGNTALVITEIQLTGDYVLESPIPSPIDPGNSTILSIKFAPTDLGARQGTLTILNNGDVPVFTINLTGEGEVEPEVYNVVTTRQNGKHDFLNIKNITFFPQNKMTIFDRWGNKVFERDGYDNAQVVFAGISDDNKQLPDGTYFYVLDKNNGDKPMHGFIYLRR